MREDWDGIGTPIVTHGIFSADHHRPLKVKRHCCDGEEVVPVLGAGYTVIHAIPMMRRTLDTIIWSLTYVSPSRSYFATWRPALFGMYISPPGCQNLVLSFRRSRLEGPAELTRPPEARKPWIFAAIVYRMCGHVQNRIGSRR